MLLSMTGFASNSLEITNKEGISAYLTINVKSLNARFFEATCKMPYHLQNLEVDIMNLLKKELMRGKVSLTIHCSNSNIFKGRVQTSLPIISDYLKAIQDIQKTCKIDGSITIADLIRLPDVLVAEDNLADTTISETIMAAIASLITKLQKERIQEGAALERDIKERMALLEKFITDIEKRSLELYQEKGKQIEKLLAEINHEKSEFAEIRRHEISLALDKVDITEELVRFKSHLKNFNTSLNDKDIEKSRRFDFILQELNREINTIAAKCSDSAISNLAISTKVELEKIREQAQNIV